MLAEQLLCFLARPYAGIELEIAISVIELSWAAFLIVCPDLLATSQTFFALSQSTPGRLVAVPWMIAGSLNIIGIAQFFRGHPSCATLRWVGGLISSLLWSWTAVETWKVGGSFLLIVISCTIATADVRIMAGATCRHRVRH